MSGEVPVRSVSSHLPLACSELGPPLGSGPRDLERASPCLLRHAAFRKDPARVCLQGRICLPGQTQWHPQWLEGSVRA